MTNKMELKIMLYLPTVKPGYSLVKIKPTISLPPPEPLATRILEIAKPAIAHLQ